MWRPFRRWRRGLGRVPRLLVGVEGSWALLVPDSWPQDLEEGGGGSGFGEAEAGVRGVSGWPVPGLRSGASEHQRQGVASSPAPSLPAEPSAHLKVPSWCTFCGLRQTRGVSPSSWLACRLATALETLAAPSTGPSPALAAPSPVPALHSLQKVTTVTAHSLFRPASFP